MAEKGLRDVVEEKLKGHGCIQVLFDVPLGRGRARADVVGYIFRGNEYEPVVLVETQVVYSLEPIYKLMGNADKLDVSTLAITDGDQWTWYQKSEHEWRRINEPNNFSEDMSLEDVIQMVNHGATRLIDDLLKIMRRSQQASLSDLGIILYAYSLWIKTNNSSNDLLDNPSVVLGNLMGERGLSLQWSSLKLSDTDLQSMVRLLQDSSRLFKYLMTHGFFEPLFARRQDGFTTTHAMLAKSIATFLCSVLPQGASVLDPAAGEGAVLAAIMSNRNDLRFGAIDENASIGFLARFFFEISDVSLQYNQRDFVRGSLHDLLMVDAIVLDPPLVDRVEAPEVLRHYEVSRGKPTPIEALFLERSIAVLNPGGYLVAVVPTTLLMRAADKHIRELIMRECYVEGVFEIASEFRPASSAKTCLLVCKKKGDGVVPTDTVTMLRLYDDEGFDPAEMLRDAITDLLQRTK